MKKKFLLLVLNYLFSAVLYSQGNFQDSAAGNAADTLFETGSLYFLEKNFDAAEKMFFMYLEKVPDNIPALEYLSQIAIAQQDIVSLNFYNSRILSLDPDNLDALISLGVIYFNDGNYDKAEKLFGRAIEIEPANESALYNLGVLYGTIGELLKSKNVLNKAAQLNPLNGKIYETLGLFYLQNQSYEEAENNLLKSISVDGSLLEARKGLIILYQNQHKLDKAAKYIGEIQAAEENYPQLNLLRANQYFLEGETDSAIVCALKQIQVEPDKEDAYYFLSTLYSLNGEEVKSQKAFAKAEQLFNDNSSSGTKLKKKSLSDSISK